jgi:predicted DNA binding CopG/RHH family protein
LTLSPAAGYGAGDGQADHLRGFKQLIAIRIDPRLLASLRRMATRLGKPYQTLIHELLERAAGHAA